MTISFYSPGFSPVGPKPVENNPALKDALARLEAQARCTAAYRVKRQARFYQQRPEMMELLSRGLSKVSAEGLIAAGKSLLIWESTFPRRNLGFGGYVPAINAKAAILLGRYRRLCERRI